MSASPAPRDLVLVGGGHTHLHVLADFGRHPEPGVRVTLISRDAETAYSGMLPGLVAGAYSHAEAHVDLRRLAEVTGTHFIQAEIDGIDIARREVAASGRIVAGYDVLSLDTGSLTDLSVPGAAEHAIPVKPVPDFLAAWIEIRRVAGAETVELRPILSFRGSEAEPGTHDRMPRLLVGLGFSPAASSGMTEQETRAQSGGTNPIVVVGGGIGGAELSLALRAGFIASGVGRAATPITLVTRTELAPELNARARRMLAAALDRNGIALATGAEIASVHPDEILAADGRRFLFANLFFATWAGAPAWLRETGLALDARGFVAVDATLRSASAATIFAAGDVAAVLAHPRAKSGVFAVRQGPPLADNLRRALRGGAVRPFVPQRQAFKLIGTGDGRAIAARGGLCAEGVWLWWLKRWIDRRWIAQYQGP